MARGLDLPAPQEPFGAGFRALLPSLLAGRGRLEASEAQRLRARRARLSQSGTFVGHRRYERGDDLRHLDWSAYARTGELFTKQLEEEDLRSVTVAVDLSPSLLAGVPQRRVGALRLAAVLGGLALARLDGVAVVAPGAPQPQRRFAGLAQLPALLEHLRALPVTPIAPEAVSAQVLATGGVGRLHWVSDFSPPSSFERPLTALRRRGARVTGWLPVIPTDEAPPESGYWNVADPETGRELAVPVDRALSRELRRQLELLRRRQRQMFAEAGAPLVRWAFAAGPVDAPRLVDHVPILSVCAR